MKNVPIVKSFIKLVNSKLFKSNLYYCNNAIHSRDNVDAFENEVTLTEGLNWLTANINTLTHRNRDRIISIQEFLDRFNKIKEGVPAKRNIIRKI